MRFKASGKVGGLLVELDPHESHLPLPTEKERPAVSRFTLKKIIVPVDFSVCSKKTLNYAARFAQQCGGQLSLVFVLPIDPPTLERLTDMDLSAEAEPELENLAKSVAHIVPAETVL